MIEVRCPGRRLLFKVNEDGRIEYRCQRCAKAILRQHGQRVVVIHRIMPGEWTMRTLIFRDPLRPRPA